MRRSINKCIVLLICAWSSASCSAPQNVDDRPERGVASDGRVNNGLTLSIYSMSDDSWSLRIPIELRREFSLTAVSGDDQISFDGVVSEHAHPEAVGLELDITRRWRAGRASSGVSTAALSLDERIRLWLPRSWEEPAYFLVVSRGGGDESQ